jgi:hypothetical protein
MGELIDGNSIGISHIVKKIRPVGQTPMTNGVHPVSLPGSDSTIQLNTRQAMTGFGF